MTAPRRPGSRTTQTALDILGWFVDWEPGEPWDADARHGTLLQWRWRLAGWFACPVRGHVWAGIHCTVKAHNQCVRCFTERGEGR